MSSFRGKELTQRKHRVSERVGDAQSCIHPAARASVEARDLTVEGKRVTLTLPTRSVSVTEIGIG